MSITLTVFGLAAIPAASATTCMVTVTFTSGRTAYYQLAQGAPISSLGLSAPVQSVYESCPQDSTPSTPTTSTPPADGGTTTSTGTTSTGTTSTGTTSTGTTSTGTASTGTTSTSTSDSQTTPLPNPIVVSPGKFQPSSHHGATTAPVGIKPIIPERPALRKPGPFVTSKGVPTPANPTYSLSLPGPAPVGVPNFFIDNFRIPPFLLPIYQAAGIEYDVPWQVLAAINEIESDYGRNLSVSSAGAVGWMQFMPATWKQYGLDANGDGIADPYNPVDAIFTAARYLHAAGASKDLKGAIFGYNHADWYVQSVLLRAQLIEGLPQQFVGALTGLVEGHFPVAAPAKYADNAVLQLAKKHVTGSNAAVAINSDPNSKTVSIFAKQDSPVIAVNDGKVVGIGQDSKLGKYVQLQDATGNVYTYAHLGSIPTLYPVPKPVTVTAAEIAKQLSGPSTKQPIAAASAGTQNAATAPASAVTAKPGKVSAAPITLPVTPAAPAQQATAQSSTAQQSTAQAGPPSAQQTDGSGTLVKERLFANPQRAASYAAGGALQVTSSNLTSFQAYFADALHLAKNQYTLEPLRRGAIVVAGAILGRIGPDTAQQASHLDFMVRPSGKNAPYIDPKPILDGWKLLEASAVYRAAGVNPFFGPGAKNPTVGQLLLMSKDQLANRVLADPHVQIYSCGQRDIRAGLIDRRILATIEFLSASGLYPTISGLQCGNSLSASTGVDAAGATGSSVDVSKINGVPVAGHQGGGSITDFTIRRLLTLQGAMRPDEIVSTMSYKDQPNTLSLPDHGDRIQIAFTPLFGANSKVSQAVSSILKPAQWDQLMSRLSQIAEPVVPITPSSYAIKVTGGK